MPAKPWVAKDKGLAWGVEQVKTDLFMVVSGQSHGDGGSDAGNCAEEVAIQSPGWNRRGQTLSLQSQLTGQLNVHDVSLGTRINQGRQGVDGLGEKETDLEKGLMAGGGLGGHRAQPDPSYIR